MSSAQSIDDMPIHELGVADAAARIARGELDSTALVDHLLSRIEQHESMNAFISIDRQGAMAAARRVDRARDRGQPLGMLAGVPIVVKDNINTGTLPTTAGTPALADFRPRSDAAVVERLVAAGAIVLGKANMHELAFGITSANAHFGFVQNAYSADHHAGGSSGGTGAAIGARLAPGGLGSDTGGSVRIPAALNGIAGLRPTSGRYPQDGIVPLSLTRDTAGPMARTVADVALLDSAMTGYDQTIAAADLSSVRLGVPAYFWADLEAETRTLAESLLTALRARGATLIDVEIDRLRELTAGMAAPLTQYEIRRDLARYLLRHDTGLDLESLAAQVASPDVAAALAGGVLADPPPAADAYRLAVERDRTALQRAYRRVFVAHELDALIFPTTIRPAGTFDEIEEIAHNGRMEPAFPVYVRNSEPGSLAGVPGLSIPIGLTTDGLPVGIELDGPADSDRALLAIGLAIESVVEPLPPPERAL